MKNSTLPPFPKLIKTCAMAAAPMATTHTVLTTWAQGHDSQANITKTAMARTARSEPLNHHPPPQTDTQIRTRTHAQTSMHEKKCTDETQ